MGSVVSRCAHSVHRLVRPCTSGGKHPEDEAMLNKSSSYDLERSYSERCSSSDRHRPLDSCPGEREDSSLSREGSRASLVRTHPKHYPPYHHNADTLPLRLPPPPPPATQPASTTPKLGRYGYGHRSRRNHRNPAYRSLTSCCTRSMDDELDMDDGHAPLARRPAPVSVPHLVDQGCQTNLDSLESPDERECLTPPPLLLEPMLSKEYIVKTYSIQNATPSSSPATQRLHPTTPASQHMSESESDADTLCDLTRPEGDTLVDSSHIDLTNPEDDPPVGDLSPRDLKRPEGDTLYDRLCSDLATSESENTLHYLSNRDVDTGYEQSSSRRDNLCELSLISDLHPGVVDAAEPRISCQPVPVQDTSPPCPRHTQPSTPLAALEQRQEVVLQQLHQLTQAVDALKGRYSIQGQGSPGAPESSGSVGSPSTIPLIGSVKSSSVPEKGAGALDLVISADPSSPPLSLVLLCEQLAQCYTVLFHTFVHSSVSDRVPQHLRSLGSPAGMKRADSQLVLTLVWKAAPQGPQLMVDPTRQTPILGEANIARYLARLLNPAADSDALAATQRDELLDLAQLQIISGNTKEKAAAVRNLNSSLGKNNWLTGSGPGLSDAVVWSALHQVNMAAVAPGNVKKWLAQCASHAMFSGVMTLVS